MIVSSGAHVAPRAGAVEAGERDRRAARDRDLPQRDDAVDEADPLAIRRDEWPAQSAAAGDRHRFERVERADEELRAVVADVDDVRPVG